MITSFVATASINTISGLKARNFIDYSKAANQGNYIIITNPILYTSDDGHNYVEDYRQYRSSAAGGSFKAITVDVHELTDQFSFGIAMTEAETLLETLEKTRVKLEELKFIK